MDKNSSVLALISTFIIIAGFYLIFGSLNSDLLDELNFPQISPTPVVKNSPEPMGTRSAEIQGFDGERVVVKKVVDGDTLQTVTGFTVRFIGIDTPETVDPRRPVGCFGKEASNKTKELLEGKEVILQKDISDTDKYNRLLRYIFLPLENGQMLFINDYLVREGFAKSSSYPPDIKFQEQLIEAERQARENQKGLWDRC